MAFPRKRKHGRAAERVETAAPERGIECTASSQRWSAAPIVPIQAPGRATRRAGAAALAALGTGIVVLAAAQAPSGKPLLGSSYLAFPTGNVGCWVTAGDLNGDGFADLIAANNGCDDNPYFGTPTITILLNNGDGTYAAPRNFDAGGYDTFVTIADVDMDGRLDAIVNNTDSMGVSVLQGSGDGTFQAPVRFGSGNVPRSVTVGDLNEDGAPDLVVPGSLPQNRGSVTVLINRGDGVFTPPVELPLAIRPNMVTIGDVNGDGRQDLAIAASSGVSILLGSGDGTFEPRTEYIRGESIRLAAIVDLNLDGRPDLAAVSQVGVSVALGIGDGRFGSRIDYEIQSFPRHLVTGDLDGDAWPDLVVTTPYSLEGVSVFRGIGDGTFLPRSDYKSARPGTSTLVDADADGYLDIATTNIDLQRVSILSNNGDGTFGGSISLPTARNPVSVAVADLNGDGHSDLGVACPTDSVVSVLLGRGGGTFAPHVEFRANPYPHSLGFGDVDGDGNADLAVASAWTRGVTVARGRGDGTFLPPGTVMETGGTPGALDLGDLNADGKDDIVTANTEANHVAVFLSPLTGTERSTWGVGGFPSSVHMADLNGDGRQDLSVVNSRSTTVSSLLASEDGRFVRMLDSPTGLGGRRHAIADLDGDGRLDLVVACTWGRDGTVSTLLGTGDGGFELAGTFPVASNPGEIAVGDLNGDGRLDVATTHGALGTVSVLLGNGDGTFGAKTEYGAGEEITGLAITDLNGDGMPDIAVGDTRGNAVRLLPNRSVGAHVVESFRAAEMETGVLVSWRISTAAYPGLIGVHVQRASHFAGPYTQATSSPLTPSSSMSYLDQNGASDLDVETDFTLTGARLRWYRLLLVCPAGQNRIAGPVVASVRVGHSQSSELFPPIELPGGTVHIRYRIGSGSGRVHLRAFDVRGRLVRQLDSKNALRPGDYAFAWDRQDETRRRVSRGVYLIQLDDGSRSLARKLVLFLE